MKTDTNLILIGPMGSGKSTVGKHLAEKLRREFFDTDIEIEKSTGVKIPLIFELEGEDGFRKRESQVIARLCTRKSIVLATGGGAVLDQQNRRILQGSGQVIYLRTSIETILERTKRDQNRPLLQTDNPRVALEGIMKIRGAMYEEIAHIIVDTDQQTLKEVVTSILADSA